MSPDDHEFKSMRESNTWSKYEIYVMEMLASLKSEMRNVALKGDVETLRRDLSELRGELAHYQQATASDISALKVKVAAISLLAGTIGGMVPVVIILVVK